MKKEEECFEDILLKSLHFPYAMYGDFGTRCPECVSGQEVKFLPLALYISDSFSDSTVLWKRLKFRGMHNYSPVPNISTLCTVTT